MVAFLVNRVRFSVKMALVVYGAKAAVTLAVAPDAGTVRMLIIGDDCGYWSIGWWRGGRGCPYAFILGIAEGQCDTPDTNKDEGGDGDETNPRASRRLWAVAASYHATPWGG